VKKVIPDLRPGRRGRRIKWKDKSGEYTALKIRKEKANH
jgi:hypothetical protein